jgi:hypothetical protein
LSETAVETTQASPVAGTAKVVIEARGEVELTAERPEIRVAGHQAHLGRCALDIA